MNYRHAFHAGNFADVVTGEHHVGPLDEEAHVRPIRVGAIFRQVDRLQFRVAVTPTAVWQETLVAIGPQQAVDRLETLAGA